MGKVRERGKESKTAISGIICGPSNSGKSTAMKNYIKSIQPAKIVFVNVDRNDFPSSLKSRYVSDIEQLEEIPASPGSLVVIDDLNAPSTKELRVQKKPTSISYCTLFVVDITDFVNNYKTA